MVTDVTLNSTEVWKLDHIVQVDSLGRPLVPQDSSYGATVFVSSDTSIATIAPLKYNTGDHGESGPFIEPVNGATGECVVTGTSTSSDPTKKVLTNTYNVTVTAPVADSLSAGGEVEPLVS